MKNHQFFVIVNKRETEMKIQTISQKRQKESGYLTVELTLVFSTIFFSLLMILFMGMVLYQQVNLQSLAVRTSARGAVIFSSKATDMETGVKKLSDFKERDPYRYIFLDATKTNEYKTILNQYVAEHIGENNVIAGISQGSDYTTIQNYVFLKRIKVNIKKDYHMPLDAVSKMFGFDKAFHIDTTAVSTAAEPVEFVRNMDLCRDVFQQTGAFSKAQETVGKIKGLIEKFSDLLH